MRHTHASHSTAGDMPIEIAQQNLRHASIVTTTDYVTTERKTRMKAVRGLWAASR
jgi:integrase